MKISWQKSDRGQLYISTHVSSVSQKSTHMGRSQHIGSWKLTCVFWEMVIKCLLPLSFELILELTSKPRSPLVSGELALYPCETLISVIWLQDSQLRRQEKHLQITTLCLLPCCASYLSHQDTLRQTSKALKAHRLCTAFWTWEATFPSIKARNSSIFP